MSTSNSNIRIEKDINGQVRPSSLNFDKYNKETIEAIKEGRKIAKDPNKKGYHTVDELKKALELWLNMKFVLQIAFKKDIIEKLARGEMLEAKYRDHSLIGDYKGTRECHIEPDWLMIYEIFEDILVLSLQRTGSHSDLF